MERTVHGITWTDDLAWMEDMKGERWEKFIKKEQERWSNVKKSKLPKIKYQIKKASAVGNQMRFSAGNVLIGHQGTMSYTWKWKGSSEVQEVQEVQEVADLCVKGDCVYVSYEDSKVPGAENYIIAAYRKGSEKPLWLFTGMSPFVGILGDRCYSIEAKNKLVYYKCVSWNCVKGDDVRVEYEEKDARYNLDLIRGEGCLYLRRQSGPKQDVINLLHKTLLQPVSLDSRRFVFGCVGEDEYLYWSGNWKASHGLKYMMPSFAKETPEYLDTRRHLLITRVYGKRTLWHISEGIPRILWRGVGNLMVDPWEGDWLRITVPGVPVVWHHLKRGIPKAVGVVQERFARSADGTEVPFYIVSHVSRPKALFISAYSAYGIPTSFSTARWVPLLTEGFAVCFGVYRGGGDHTPEWEDAGRLGGRMKVLEDAEAVVREARRVCYLPASKTVIYGRSAGGLWVGGLCSRHPRGDLFGGAYMEVPYLDVLRTTTNHSLPLTLLETDEFGLPSLRISDFAGILQWSPMETLGGGTDMFQIVRTGLNDPQVFAYESAKWVERNRGKGVYLAIEGDQGHFVNGSTGLRQKAEDLSVIIDFIKS